MSAATAQLRCEERRQAGKLRFKGFPNLLRVPCEAFWGAGLLRSGAELFAEPTGRANARFESAEFAGIV
jgi:hypothetical protein